MGLKTLDDFNFKGKRILLRVDLNSEVVGNKIQDSPRFKEHAKTIKELLKRKAVVVILAHQGRPNKSDFTSLKQHARILNKYVKVKFVDDVIGKKAVKAIEKLKGGEALLLDNVRYVSDEFKPGNNKFVKSLGKRFDYYINDAFSTMHRNNTSIVSFPRHIKSGIGRVAENEIKNLNELKSRLKDSVLVLGGNKPSDVVLLMNHHKILTTGTLSLLALKAKGYKLGKADKILKSDLKIVAKIKSHSRGMLVPKDIAINSRGKRKELSVKELPTDSLILDIGSKTIKEYSAEIRKAKAVFFKGVAGMIEDKKFELGTKSLLKVMGSSHAFSVIAGGSSSSAVSKFKINKKRFNHVSLSGGALVHYLAGKRLPGLEVLK